MNKNFRLFLLWWEKGKENLRSLERRPRWNAESQEDPVDKTHLPQAGFARSLPDSDIYTWVLAETSTQSSRKQRTLFLQVSSCHRDSIPALVCSNPHPGFSEPMISSSPHSRLPVPTDVSTLLTPGEIVVVESNYWVGRACLARANYTLPIYTCTHTYIYSFVPL